MVIRRARWVGVALVFATACGFGDYHTKSSGTGGATSSTTASGTTTMATSSSSDASSSSATGGGPECPMGNEGLAEEDCWTLKSETATGNAACVKLAADQVPVVFDSATERVRYQRLRSLDGEVFAIGSRKRGLNAPKPDEASAWILRLPASGAPITAAYIDQPESSSGMIDDFIELSDYVGADQAYLAGIAVGPAQGQLGSTSTIPHAFAARAHKNVDHGQLDASLEPLSPMGYSRVAAIASSDPMTAPTFGIAEAGANSDICNTQVAGTYATRWTWSSSSLASCVFIGAPCVAPTLDEELVPFDIVMSGGHALAAGQICDGLGVVGSPTGFVVPIEDTSPPTLGTAALLTPDDGSSSATVVAVRALGSQFVVAGTFKGHVTAGSFHLASAGGTDAFVAVLDASLAFIQAASFGGAGEDVLTDADVEPHDATTWGLYVVGRFTGATQFGCFTDAGSAAPQAFLSKILVGATFAPTPLNFVHLGAIGPSRADRVAVGAEKIYLAGRIEAGSTLSIGGKSVPANAMPGAAGTFLVSLARADEVTP